MDGETRMFEHLPKDVNAVRSTLEDVAKAMQDKGYDPVVQWVGYLLSGDPSYITSHRGARNRVRQIPRDEIIEELVRHYLKA